MQASYRIELRANSRPEASVNTNVCAALTQSPVSAWPSAPPAEKLTGRNDGGEVTKMRTPSTPLDAFQLKAIRAKVFESPVHGLLSQVSATLNS